MERKIVGDNKMKFNISKDIEKQKTIYTLIIDDIDRVEARFTTHDKMLFEDCSGDAPISSKLWALETLARRIEESRVGELK